MVALLLYAYTQGVYRDGSRVAVRSVWIYRWGPLIVGDFQDSGKIASIIREHDAKAVMHLQHSAL
jgi:UDP-glucose 4-epimerase